MAVRILCRSEGGEGGALTENLPPLAAYEVDFRAAAAAAGQRRYTTGKPCPAGHNGERYTLNGYCVQCQRNANACNRERLRGLLQGRAQG